MKNFKFNHQLKSSKFLTYDETDIQGSCTVFAFLWQCLLTKDMFALGQLVQRKNKMLELVALIPQVGEKETNHSIFLSMPKRIIKFLISPLLYNIILQEEVVDSNGIRLKASGFHVVVLPFQDDFRVISQAPLYEGKGNFPLLSFVPKSHDFSFQAFPHFFPSN